MQVIRPLLPSTAICLVSAEIVVLVDSATRTRLVNHVPFLVFLLRLYFVPEPVMERFIPLRLILIAVLSIAFSNHSFILPNQTVTELFFDREVCAGEDGCPKSMVSNKLDAFGG